MIDKVLVAGVATALVITLQPPAHAGHRPNFYCSESGDICQATKKSDGKRVLAISLAAKYISRYRLCVRAPDGTRACKRFNIEEYDGLRGDSRPMETSPTPTLGSYTVVERNSSTLGGQCLRLQPVVQRL